MTDSWGILCQISCGPKPIYIARASIGNPIPPLPILAWGVCFMQQYNKLRQKTGGGLDSSEIIEIQEKRLKNI